MTLRGQGNVQGRLRFMEIMDSSTPQDGNYLMSPFKRPDVHVPNCFSVAKQRLIELKRRFLSNSDFHKEYTCCLNDVIERGYAENVPQKWLQGTSGKVWYIPHHGVHHARIGSLQVVFDCGATFQGTSLNSELLQGSNLTSSLLGVLI